jgi:hypothetical protein
MDIQDLAILACKKVASLHSQFLDGHALYVAIGAMRYLRASVGLLPYIHHM